MNQQLVAGIGNVYKSEILFINRLSPFKSVAEFDDDTLRQCRVRVVSCIPQSGQAATQVQGSTAVTGYGSIVVVVWAALSVALRLRCAAREKRPAQPIFALSVRESLHDSGSGLVQARPAH